MNDDHVHIGHEYMAPYRRRVRVTGARIPPGNRRLAIFYSVRYLDGASGPKELPSLELRAIPGTVYPSPHAALSLAPVATRTETVPLSSVLPSLGAFCMTDIQGIRRLVKVLEVKGAGYKVCFVSVNGVEGGSLSTLRQAHQLYLLPPGEAEPNE